MKINIKTCHKDYYNCKIFIDGVETPHVVEVDDAKGYADVFQIDDDGRCIATDDQKSILTKRIYGQIRIEKGNKD